MDDIVESVQLKNKYDALSSSMAISDKDIIVLKILQGL